MRAGLAGGVRQDPARVASGRVVAAVTDGGSSGLGNRHEPGVGAVWLRAGRRGDRAGSRRRRRVGGGPVRCLAGRDGRAVAGGAG